MHILVIIPYLILILILVLIYIQNNRLNRELKEKKSQLQAVTLELKEAQAKLMDNGKRGAVAALSAGLLHQLSQPITAIHGFVRYMKKEMDINSPFYKPVCAMDEQSSYIKDMLANLMELVLHRKVQKTQMNINTVIYKSFNLLLDELRIRRIGWDIQLDDQMPFILGDALHLQQVFMNLIVNAMESLNELPHEKPRTLVVSSRIDFEKHQAVVTFKDNGPGIAPEDQRIGLTLCHDLIREHGGEISMQKNEDGILFTVKLPCIRLDKVPQGTTHEAA